MVSSLSRQPARNYTVLGLDVGGTKTAVVEGTRDAQILQRFEMATEGHRPFDQFFPQIAKCIERAIEKAGRSGRQVVALSVSIGGPLSIKEGVLLNPPHLPGWHNVRLMDLLANRFSGLPVYIEHDGNAGALAEFQFGVGRNKRDLRHLIFLTFGTGLGAGLIINGEIVHGVTDTAGEVGHFRLAQEGPVGYGKAGSWEGFASGAGMVQLACQMFPNRWSAETTIYDLVNAVLVEDPEALMVAADVGTWLGRGMALLIDALNPQIIVLGSLAVVLGERVLASARRVLAEEALPQAVGACEVLPAALGKRLGDVAALMAALNRPEVVKMLEVKPV
ncbi:MAG: ROK family protein [bacterium]